MVNFRIPIVYFAILHFVSTAHVVLQLPYFSFFTVKRRQRKSTVQIIFQWDDRDAGLNHHPPFLNKPIRLLNCSHVKSVT